MKTNGTYITSMKKTGTNATGTKQAGIKKLAAAALLILISTFGYACPVCEKQQPAPLRGITHGAGPESSFDYIIVSVTALVVLFTLAFTIRYLVKPGEGSGEHIKRLILNNESYG